MLSPIKYQIGTDDELRRETYRYWFNDHEMRLILDGYCFEERKSKRHGWKVVAEWERYRSHHNQMSREQIPQREEVRQAVLKQFVDSITIE